MSDLYHYYGSDLTISSTGDILTSSGTEEGQERVLRRLLTSPGDVVFHPTYGAGVGRMVGQTLDIPKVKSIIRSQIFLESVVSKTPDPVITVTAIPNGLNCVIKYTDAVSKNPVTLNFNVSQ